MTDTWLQRLRLIISFSWSIKTDIQLQIGLQFTIYLYPFARMLACKTKIALSSTSTTQVTVQYVWVLVCAHWQKTLPVVTGQVGLVTAPLLTEQSLTTLTPPLGARVTLAQWKYLLGQSTIRTLLECTYILFKTQSAIYIYQNSRTLVSTQWIRIRFRLRWVRRC